MNDLLPEQSPIWQLVESTLIDILQRYGYQEIRFPIVESNMEVWRPQKILYQVDQPSIRNDKPIKIALPAPQPT